MRIAILSDIHANYWALHRVLRYVYNELQPKPDQVCCLGDVVGYGPRPITCINLVHKYIQKRCLGNHDHFVDPNLELESYVNPVSIASLIWTKQTLMSSSDGRKGLDFLLNAPFHWRIGRAMFVHGIPSKSNDDCVYDYIRSPKFKGGTESIEKAIERIEVKKDVPYDGIDTFFVGHSHTPFVVKKPFGADISEARCVVFNYEPPNDRIEIDCLELPENELSIVNVGSVGQPRDRDPRACIVVYDTEKRTVEHIRIPYEVEKTVQEILGYVDEIKKIASSHGLFVAKAEIADIGKRLREGR